MGLVFTMLQTMEANNAPLKPVIDIPSMKKDTMYG